MMVINLSSHLNNSFMDYAKRVDQHLDKILSNKDSLTKIMRYSVLSGGKRFRPTLIYTVAQTFDTNLDLADASACAIELIHAYSLIHDDLPAMDDDDIRHNQPACHKQFGEAQAILAGDGLQALAFEVLSSDMQLSAQIRIKAIQVLTHASFEMAQGQSIDLGIASKIVDADTLKDMHQKKTGSLLSCAVKLGALVSDSCSEQDIHILENFAKNIGLAYQIQDDVLDVLTPEEVLGKKQNSDANKNKPTYPVLFGLERSKYEFKRLYQQALSGLDALSVDVAQLKALTLKLQDRKF